jgi:hypothetical protein
MLVRHHHRRGERRSHHHAIAADRRRLPRQNGMSQAWRRRMPSAIPASPDASWAVDTIASTRFLSWPTSLTGCR